MHAIEIMTSLGTCVNTKYNTMTINSLSCNMARSWENQKVLCARRVQSIVSFIVEGKDQEVEWEVYCNINYTGSKQQAECRSPSTVFANTRDGKFYY